MSIRKLPGRYRSIGYYLFLSPEAGLCPWRVICLDNEEWYQKMREFLPLYEGFLTYGGMSVREMEAMVVGLDETMDENMISQGPCLSNIWLMSLRKKGFRSYPCRRFGLSFERHDFSTPYSQTQYPAGAPAALYSEWIRGMERGTMSEQRDEMELNRCPIWSFYVWPCRGGCLLYPRSNMRLTV